MKCIHCGNEMEAGNLRTEGGPGLFYMPDGEDYGEFPTQKKIESKGGIGLTPRYWILSTQNSFYYRNSLFLYLTQPFKESSCLPHVVKGKG